MVFLLCHYRIPLSIFFHLRRTRCPGADELLSNHRNKPKLPRCDCIELYKILRFIVVWKIPFFSQYQSRVQFLFQIDASAFCLFLFSFFYILLNSSSIHFNLYKVLTVAFKRVGMGIRTLITFWQCVWHRNKITSVTFYMEILSRSYVCYSAFLWCYSKKKRKKRE